MKNFIIIGLIVCFPHSDYMNKTIQNQYQVFEARARLMEVKLLDENGNPTQELKDIEEKIKQWKMTH